MNCSPSNIISLAQIPERVQCINCLPSCICIGCEMLFDQRWFWKEAHSFIRRGGNDEGVPENPAQLCRETFEKIAREGRKFGLSLLLSSQRPSELSPTILAQCNTFLLHRIVNDFDQALVARLVPDNVAGPLKELPSLPSRQAVLLGWATPIPLLVEMDELAFDIDLAALA